MRLLTSKWPTRFCSLLALGFIVSALAGSTIVSFSKPSTIFLFSATAREVREPRLRHYTQAAVEVSLDLLVTYPRSRQARQCRIPLAICFSTVLSLMLNCAAISRWVNPSQRESRNTA